MFFLRVDGFDEFVEFSDLLLLVELPLSEDILYLSFGRLDIGHKGLPFIFDFF